MFPAEGDRLQINPNAPRLLVADDDPELRHLLQKTLTREGFRVDTAPNGVEAINQLRNSGIVYDLLISDLRMPEKDGAQLLLEARTLNPTLKVIIISGCTELDQYLRLLKKGAFEYITKPFKIPDLLDVIDRAMEARTV